MNKTHLILDLIEHPEKYTDREIDEILSDPEAAEIYKVVSRMQDAFYTVPQPDIDAEWERFAASQNPLRPRFLMFFTRHAAAILVITLASAVAVAAGFGIRAVVTPSSETKEITDISPSTPDSVEVQTADVLTAEDKADIVIFRENTLSEILRNISDHYSCELVFKAPSSGNLRLYFKWDRNQKLADVIEMLNNFDHINITLDDNTLTVE